MYTVVHRFFSAICVCTVVHRFFSNVRMCVPFILPPQDYLLEIGHTQLSLSTPPTSLLYIQVCGCRGTMNMVLCCADMKEVEQERECERERESERVRVSE